MATLPTVQDLGPRKPVQGSTGVRRVANADAVGKALQGFGNAVFNEGNQIAEREATAAAKERDTYAADAVRDALYNPETGFMNQKGRNAVDLQKDMDDALLKIREESLKGLTKYAASKVDGQLQRRIDGAQQQVMQHTTRERETWINGASEARIVSAQQDAIFNPAATAASEKTIIGEVMDQANREGWDPEKTKVMTEAKISQMYVAQIDNLASINPIDALGYLQANEDKMTESDRAGLLKTLRPEAKAYRGRQAGAAAVTADQVGDAFATASSAVGLDENGKREALQAYLADGGVNLDPAVTAWCAAFINATLAKSGVEGTGSNMARSFLNWGEEAAVPKQGDLVVLERGDPPFGHVGFFAGFDENGDVKILGGNQSDGVNVQTYAADRVLGYRRAPMGDQTGAPSGELNGLRSIANIDDPDERSAALGEYNLMTGIAEKEAQAASEQALNNAWAMVDNGGDLNSLTRAEKEKIGFNGIRALQQYQQGSVTTDQGYMTGLFEQYATSPEAFMAQDPTDWLGHLDRSDYEQMVKLRANLIAGDRTSGMTPPAVSTMLSTATAALDGAGITKKDQPEDYNKFQTELTRWATENPKEANDPTALQGQINRMLIPVYLNPRGTTGNRRKQDTTAFQLNLDGEPLDPNDDLTIEDLYQSTITIAGNDVPQSAMERVATGYMTKMNRMPTSDEMMNALIKYYGGL